jgi:hypothetical protein
VAESVTDFSKVLLFRHGANGGVCYNPFTP